MKEVCVVAVIREGLMVKQRINEVTGQSVSKEESTFPPISTIYIIRPSPIIIKTEQRTGGVQKLKSQRYAATLLPFDRRVQSHTTRCDIV